MGMIVNPFSAFGGGTPVVQAWNPADHDAAFVLSGSDLIATRSAAANAYKSGRALVAATGKRYWETTMTANGGFTPPFAAHGVCTISFSMIGGQGIGAATGSWGFQSRDGDTYAQGTQTVLGYTPIGVGDTLMTAYDSATGKLWWGRNGTWYASGNPGAGTGQHLTVPGGNTVYPSSSLYSSGTSHTSKFVSGFTYTPPSGFTGF
jgi:hypothetical protein